MTFQTHFPDNQPCGFLEFPTFLAVFDPPSYLARVLINAALSRLNSRYTPTKLGDVTEFIAKRGRESYLSMQWNLNACNFIISCFEE